MNSVGVNYLLTAAKILLAGKTRGFPRVPEGKHSSPTASGDFFDKDRTVSSRLGMLTKIAFKITVSKINKANQSKASLV